MMGRYLTSLFGLSLLLAVAVPGTAQSQPRTISAGMTPDEVRAAFGAPNVVRQADGWTYFFYTNRCLPRCGTDDTVFFYDGGVVAAVLHSPARRFAGPAAAAALRALPQASEPGAFTSPAEGGAAVTGIRVRAPEAAEQPAVDLGVIRGRPGAAAEVAAPEDTADAAQVAPVPAGPDQERQQRERRVEPTTVRPEPQRTPAAQPPAPEPQPQSDVIQPNTIRRRP